MRCGNWFLVGTGRTDAAEQQGYSDERIKFEGWRGMRDRAAILSERRTTIPRDCFPRIESPQAPRASQATVPKGRSRSSCLRSGMLKWQLRRGNRRARTLGERPQSSARLHDIRPRRDGAPLPVCCTRARTPASCPVPRPRPSRSAVSEIGALSCLRQWQVGCHSERRGMTGEVDAVQSETVSRRENFPVAARKC